MDISSNSRANASPLREAEIIWRGRYNFLESHGYRLRQRYKPDWKPSWMETKRIPEMHEDYTPHRSAVVIDATRLSDGRRVFLKRVYTFSSEIVISRYLSDSERMKEEGNHTAPLLDEFLDDEDDDYTYMVLPFLRPYDFPEFYAVDEVVDFVKQTLEGLIYMHNLNIAHRDCSDLNIMMDADRLYPYGFHPTRRLADSSGYKRAHPKRRRDVSYVQYYFIDFGISSMFGPEERNRNVLGMHGQDPEVPELSDTFPYDPFFVDIFILGNLYKNAFLKEYTNLAFLEPLIEEMTEDHWMNRCTARTALRVFNRIISEQSQLSLRWRLKKRTSGKAIQFFQDLNTISRESIYFARALMSLTSKSALQSLQGYIGRKGPAD